MPAIFVHGVPDTYRVWDRVQSRLSRSDVTVLSLPGFDSPVPDGFTATKDEYADWIIAQLEQYPEPVDLVGHDWGCALTVRIASLRPDLVRTWAAGSGSVSRDYEWHELAKIWQTPVAGEQWMDNLDPSEFSRQLEGFDVPADVASEMTGHIDARMKDCILRLYRSAIQAGAEWEPGLANITAPGLVFWGKSDPACPIEFAERLKKDTKASQAIHLDCGHWTPIQCPDEIAQALQDHWSIADSK
jgi:pimeloyl-ACP methyl ester carboxylesterase